jgi:deazaflavin-dependent oxidoreductase (nitroreductase family)
MNLKDEAAKVITATHRALVRVSGGRILGQVFGMQTVILTTTGRKSGQPRETMLTAPVVDGETVVLVASWGGDDRHPMWYLNLRENPEVVIDRGQGSEPMLARTATADEKAALWPRIVETYKGYGGYQKRTERDIPVVLLTPR